MNNIIYNTMFLTTTFIVIMIYVFVMNTVYERMRNPKRCKNVDRIVNFQQHQSTKKFFSFTSSFWISDNVIDKVIRLLEGGEGIGWG
jgi:hypothetical protein